MERPFFAVGPGKQLPPPYASLQTVQSLPFQETAVTAATPGATPSPSGSWRLRDAAESLLSRGEESAADDSNRKMVLSTHFDEETSLARIRRDKVLTVRQAFDAAATTVLEALQKQQTYEHDDEQELVPNNLPAVLHDMHRLEEIRATSLARSHDNKEYTKRKSPKVVGQMASKKPPAPKAAETTQQQRKAAASPTASTTEAAPKFTRNTPASSAAALDFRFNSSRAILCVAGNLAFDALTPVSPGHEWDALDVPQNPERNKEDTNRTSSSSSSSSSEQPVNMGAVVVEAQKVAQRTISVVENAIRRSKQRYQFRKDSARYDQPENDKGFLRVDNPFQWKKDDSSEEEEDLISESAEDTAIPYQPNGDSITYQWQSLCLPRFLSILQTGAGHAVYHDVQWSSRHGRIADLLRALTVEDTFGPHLIVTTEPELSRFGQEFYDMSSHLRLITTNDSKSLRAMNYHGSQQVRRKLRRHFPTATGLPESPFHVLVTSYDVFFKDFLHFCQLPFHTVILDEGVAWMSACDQNSTVGNIWDNIFSSSDHHVGLAGTSFKEWDYSKDEFSEATLKESWIGLTARHRIMTASTFALHQRQSAELVPISELVGFVAPQFSAVAKEEWDRSRISTDAASMKHFRKLVARSVVVHSADSPVGDMCMLALQALTGKLPSPDRSGDPVVPQAFSDDAFVSSGKIAFSRRSSLLWLGHPDRSWLRYELGTADFYPILDAMKKCDNHGHICEEITTASSTTASGQSGQVAGTAAYRLGIRCGRHFGSEQGLRQHVSAWHAPAGTWLCRTCGSDCITSQARTHHERSCGQPATGTSSDAKGSVGATPTVGQGSGPKSGVGKKKSGRAGTAATVKETDPDGSFRVPGYRGVWVNKAGKHFVKVNKERLTENGELLLFESVDDAARKYDDVVKKQKDNKKVELNFKPDGSRIVYEDINPASTSGIGGSAANVVPALSVINIKDLPPHIKPLLRDPRQTSRTGANSKRHIYAYRGVCRQARKGHDRWQSQISFMGVNHYLGTFDSEWDAAAVYAWAHLILYGEEATRQAQKEGEEAAAAYEQEKRDIAAGKIPEPPPKPEKKKKRTTKKTKEEKSSSKTGKEEAAGGMEAPKKRKTTTKTSPEAKKARATSKTPKVDKDLGPTLSKAVSKAPAVAPRDAFESLSDLELISLTAPKVTAARDAAYCGSIAAIAPAPVVDYLRPSIPPTFDFNGRPLRAGGALLLGLPPARFGWDLQDFVEASHLASEQDTMAALQLLAVEYDEDGVNEKFRSLLQGTSCVLGCAGKTMMKAYKSLGLGTIPMGASAGRLDCHVGGVPGSCSENAACIRYAPTETSEFQFSCLSEDDIVTLNGRRLRPDTGSFPLFNEDVCTVGARVFIFLLPV